MDTSEARGVSGSLPIVTGKKLMLFAGRANPELAAKIAHKLAIELGHITLKTFSAGEVYCRFDESVRGADVFIVQPTCGNPETGVTANDALMELLVMIDAAVGASAHRVIAVMPWYGYSRQDKKSALREPITARLVAQLLETAGADRVLTVDLHAGQVQGFFRKPVDHMTALLLICRLLRRARARRPGRRRARRRAREAQPQVRRHARRRPRADDQGAAGAAGRRGRLRDRRRARQDRGDPRRHHRHRGHADRRRSDGARRGRGAGVRGLHPPGVLGSGVRAARELAVRAGGRDRHDPAPTPGRRTTSSCCRAPGCSPTRSARSSPTGR